MRRTLLKVLFEVPGRLAASAGAGSGSPAGGGGVLAEVPARCHGVDAKGWGAARHLDVAHLDLELSGGGFLVLRRCALGGGVEGRGGLVVKFTVGSFWRTKCLHSLNRSLCSATTKHKYG